MYAFAVPLAVALILKTILLPGAKLQVEGSAAPLAIPVSHDAWTPLLTATLEPHGLRPVASDR